MSDGTDGTADRTTDPTAGSGLDRFDVLSHLVNEVVLVADIDRRVVYISPSIEGVLGFTPDDYVGGSTRQVIHPDDLEASRRESELVRERPGNTYRIEIRMQHRNGEWRWIEVSGANRLDDPRVRGVVNTLRDVSDRRAAEEKLRRSEERFRSLAGSLPVGAFEFDRRGRLTYVNEKWNEINGYEPIADFEAGAWAALVSSPTDGVLDAWSDAVRDSRPFEAQIQVHTARGDDRWLAASSSPVESADGVVRSFVGTIHDITDLVTARNEIERFKEIIDQTSDYVGVVDGDGHAMYFNRAGREAVGMALDDAVANFDPRSIYPAWAWRRVIDEALPVVMRGEVWSGELALLTPDRRGERPITQVLFAHRDADGEIEYLASISRDVTDEKALAARLHHQATHDQLTALPQRVVFTDRLRDSLAAAASDPSAEPHDTGLGVLFFDIDGFKAVNDSLGHHAGDELLRVLARRLEGALRDGDTPARFAGDEFVVLCHDLADDEQALEVAERVRRHVTGSVRLPPATANDPDRAAEIEIRISMGVVRARSDESVEDVVRRADLAMYAAKTGGGDRIHLSR